MKPSYSLGQVEEVKTLYLQGCSTRQVAIMVSLSPTIVAGIVKKANISRDRMIATHLNQVTLLPKDWSFFPLTPEKAWLLGVLYGDGNLDKHGYLVTLTSGDRDIINNTNRILGGKIGVRTRSTTCYDLQISSKRLWQELYDRHALTPNKSRTMHYPDLEDTMKSHFIRGLIDSDGCWFADRRSKMPRLIFQYLSLSPSFVECLRDDLIRFVRASSLSNVLTRNLRNGEAYCIYYRNRDAVRIGEWVYAHSTQQTRCERKFAIWSRFADTSKMCSGCGNLQPMPLYKRTYSCKKCGLVMDRDENSAVNILTRFLARPGPHTDDSVRCADVFTAIDYV